MSDLRTRLQALSEQSEKNTTAEAEKYLPPIVALATAKMEESAAAGNNHHILSVLSAGDVPKDLRAKVARLIIEHYGSDGFECMPLSNSSGVRIGW